MKFSLFLGYVRFIFGPGYMLSKYKHRITCRMHFRLAERWIKKEVFNSFIVVSFKHGYGTPVLVFFVQRLV